jgi:hypothetical protein
MKDLTKGEIGNEYVAKVSRELHEHREVYFNDVMMQMKAKLYAEKFNARFGKKVVDFLEAYVAELVDRPLDLRGLRPVIGVEEHIHGEYVKYNNNWDWSNERRNTPQAFSHFTYEESGHTILICDLQGVGDRWTDPQIHSIDGRGYGKGNMGERGIKAFLANHRCNSICKDLKLPPVGKPAKSLAEGTRLPLRQEERKQALEDDEPGGELTRTQRKAEKVAKELNLPAVAAVGANKGSMKNRLVVQVCKVTGLGAVGTVGGVFDAAVTVMCGTQTCETRVVYGSAAPEWNQRFQMALDSSVANLVAVVFDWTSVNQGLDPEPPIVGMVTVPFHELKDDAGFDEREWPLVQVQTTHPTGATIRLKILRYENGPKSPVGRAGGAASPTDMDGQDKERLLQGMQGIKVMVREVEKLRVSEDDVQLYAFVHIDNCEARTRSAKNDGANSNVVWNQKMAFPSCSARSLITVKVFNESKPPVLVASKAFPVDALPWDSQGHVSSVFFDLDLEGWALDLGAAAGNQKSETPRLHLQAWILSKHNAQLAHQPPASPSAAPPRQPPPRQPPVPVGVGSGTVSC